MVQLSLGYNECGWKDSDWKERCVGLGSAALDKAPSDLVLAGHAEP